MWSSGVWTVYQGRHVELQKEQQLVQGKDLLSDSFWGTGTECMAY
jgi:hypothetical protein